MASVNAHQDFLIQYKSISSKLKKRFLRKTNVAEPSDQFAALGAACERDGNGQYAGMCWLAVGRCEQSLGRTGDEAWALVRAGRQFLGADTVARRLGVAVPKDENIQAGISCVSDAGGLWQGELDAPLAGGLALETGAVVDDASLAHAQYRHASVLLAASPPLQLHAFHRLASAAIRLGDYDGALSVFTEMALTAERAADPPFGFYADILLRCEISRVLLLLLLRPTPQKLPAVLATVLEKYTWIADSPQSRVSWLSDELFLLLQSLVLACQAQDSESLQVTETQLWPHLTAEQRDLLHGLVKAVASDTMK